MKMTYDIRSWRFWAAAAFVALAAALPVAFYLRTYDSVTVKYTILQLGLLAALACWLAGGLLEGRFEVPAGALPVLLPACALFAWNLARFATAPYQVAAFGGFLTQQLFLLSLILPPLIFSERYLRYAVLAVVGGWAVVVLYGLAQYFGLDPFIWKGAFGANVFSTIGNPDYFAAYLAVSAPFALMLTADDSLPGPLRWAAGALSVVGGAVAALTGARLEAYVYLAVLAGFSLTAYFRLRSAASRRSLYFAAAAAAACLLAMSFLAPARSSFSSDSAHTAVIRRSAFEMAKKAGLAGFGPGSFWVHYPKFRSPEQIVMHHRHNIQTDHAGNELLEQWAEGGAVGALLWLALFAAVLYGAFGTVYAAGTGPYGYGLAFSVLGGLAVSMVSLNVHRTLPGGWLLYFCAGLSVMLSARREDRRQVLALPVPLGGFKYFAAAAALALACWGAYFSARMFTADIKHNLGIYYSKQAQWNSALGAYAQEFPGSNYHVMAQYFMGNIFMDRGDPGDTEKALEQYRKVRQLAPDYVQVHYREALALKKLGRYAEAAERMERQVRLDPVWEEAWQELVGIYELMGDKARAAEAGLKAAEAKGVWAGSRPASEKPVARKELRLLAGIGVRASFPDGRMFVESVLQEMPADKAGLRTGDQIFEITPRAPANYAGEGRTFVPRKFSAEAAARELAGEVGSKVTLIVWPAAGRKEAVPPKNAGPGWRGRVKVIQLRRVKVRDLPEGISHEGAIKLISDSGVF
jgi:tetratricopeptide (TPR) repeat protein